MAAEMAEAGPLLEALVRNWNEYQTLHERFALWVNEAMVKVKSNKSEDKVGFLK